MLSFHLNDSSVGKITNSAKEKEGKVLSYPVDADVCFSESPEKCLKKVSIVLQKKKSALFCISAYELCLCFMNSLSVHLFAHQSLCVHKGRHFKTARRNLRGHICH